MLYRRQGYRLWHAKRALEQRMVRLFVDDPVAFRRQSGGDYPDRHTLDPQIAAGITGIPAHIASDRTGAVARGISAARPVSRF
jgi:hypothetical protein